MPRYWVIAPFWANDPDWDAIWQFDLDNGVISIGWKELGDASRLSEQEISNRHQSTWTDATAGARTQAVRMVHKFYHAITPGDIVIARRGTKMIAGIGTVTKKAFYDSELLRELFRSFGEEYEADAWPNHLGVSWAAAPRDLEFESTMFGMQTLYEIPDEKYRELVAAQPISSERTSLSDLVPSVENDFPEQVVRQSNEFALEKHLEDFIVTNFAAIFERKLVLYSEPGEGPLGQQYSTDVGIIDILARDAITGDFFVIELKKGRPADKVVGQVLRYMGWVAQELCENGENVYGIVVCAQDDPKLRYALKFARNVSVKYYQIDFKLLDAPTKSN